jgi:hypothetical protein
VHVWLSTDKMIRRIFRPFRLRQRLVVKIITEDIWPEYQDQWTIWNAADALASDIVFRLRYGPLASLSRLTLSANSTQQLARNKKRNPSI